LFEVIFLTGLVAGLLLLDAALQLQIPIMLSMMLREPMIAPRYRIKPYVKLIPAGLCLASGAFIARDRGESSVHLILAFGGSCFLFTSVCGWIAIRNWERS